MWLTIFIIIDVVIKFELQGLMQVNWYNRPVRFGASCQKEHAWFIQWKCLHTKYSLRFKIELTFRHKSDVLWNFSQNSSNELECCQKQCKCCRWYTTKSNNNLHLSNNWYSDSTASTHINAILCASVASTQIGGLRVKLAPIFFYFTIDTPSSHGSA